MTGDADKVGGDPAPAVETTAKGPASPRRFKPRVVEIVFTPEQIAYLDERMRIVTEAKPTRRAGGSSLMRRLRAGLIAA